jgi:hypothetical protein
VSGKLTLYPVRGASRYFVLPDGEGRIAGRDPGSDLVLEDPRVSARHARFAWRDSGWTLVDLGSKNGTFVNGAPVEESTLSDEDWISFGGLLSRFEILSEDQVRRLQSERRSRLQTSVEIRQGLRPGLEASTLLRRLIHSVLDVAGAERGFVLLLSPNGSLQCEVAAGFSPEEPLDDSFAGSFGAIQKVLETGRSVVARDAKSDAFLGKRPSVVAMGIGSLACVPLIAEGRVLGLIYVDGRREGGSFSDLDLEILEALADHASLVAASLRIDREIRLLLQRPSGEPASGSPAFLDQLARRVGELVPSGARAASRAHP